MRDKEPIFYTNTGFGKKRIDKQTIRKNKKTLRQIYKQGEKMTMDIKYCKKCGVSREIYEEVCNMEQKCIEDSNKLYKENRELRGLLLEFVNYEFGNGNLYREIENFKEKSEDLLK